MVSRRLLRIKILQILYAYYKKGKPAVDKLEKELFFSIEKTHELYISVFALLKELVRYANYRIELSRNKLSPTAEDLNPNTNFVDNKVIAKLSENPSLKKYIDKYKVNWGLYPELIKNMYIQITNSDYYARYMKENEPSLKADYKFVNHILYRAILNCEMLDSLLEEKSIYWNNDIEIAVRQVERTLKKIREGEEPEVLSLYKDSDDREFVRRLFRHVTSHDREYTEMIESFTSNWDVERIAFMDILIMQQAIAEIIEFENIPTRVSFNEYIDIAKFFSTQKSSNFINGVLDRIIQKLKEDNKIIKSGRGLIGEG